MPGETVVACCQIAPRVGETEANRAASLAAIDAAAAAGAQVVLLPELTSSGYVFRNEAEARALAEPADGLAVTAWAERARAHGIVVVAGFCEAAEDGTLRNSAVLVDPTGVRAVYRKAHLWDREKLVFTPGDAPPPVVDTLAGRIGVVVCYDLEFPEWMRLPALAGAQLIAAPTNWPAGPLAAEARPAELVRAAATAVCNRVFVAVCDRHGHERGVDWVGGSAVIDLDAQFLAGPPADRAEGLLVASCALAAADDKRISERNDVFADRRPELYGAVAAAGRDARAKAPAGQAALTGRRA